MRPIPSMHRTQITQLERLKASIEEKSLVYPDYYLKPFHTYATGNLEWLAAAEVRWHTLCVRGFACKCSSLALGTGGCAAAPKATEAAVR